MYNEQIRDLLAPPDRTPGGAAEAVPVKLQYDPRCGATVLSGVLEQVRPFPVPSLSPFPSPFPSC